MARKKGEERDYTHAIGLVIAERDKLLDVPYEEMVARYGMSHETKLFGLITRSTASSSQEAHYEIVISPNEEYEVSVELWPGHDNPGSSLILEIRETSEFVDAARAWIHLDAGGRVTGKGHRLLGESGDWSSIPDSG